MKICILSEFRSDYPVGLEYSYARGFEALGHTVVRISLADRFAFDTGIPRLDRHVGRILRQRSLRDEVIAEGPELVVLGKAIGVLSSTVRAWRAQGMKVINVFPDNPFEMIGMDLFGPTLLAQFRALERVFVHDRFVVGQLRQLGIPSAFIACARDPVVHDPDAELLPLPNPPRLVFVGNPDIERVRYLRAVADLGLAVWGRWDWARLRPGDPLLACVRGPDVVGSEMVRCLRSAEISINVMRRSQKTAHNMRSFESPGCRACTLSEASYGVLELFEDGREVVTFTSPSELRARAIEMLASPGRRAEVAQAGWERVKEETYTRRAGEVIASA